MQKVWNKVTGFTATLVNKFLQRVKKEEENIVQINRRKELKNLGLVEVSFVDVLCCLSNRALTEAKPKLLNRELDLSLLSTRLDVQFIRTEFENLY